LLKADFQQETEGSRFRAVEGVARIAQGRLPTRNRREPFS